jgi:hypothetical protein
VGLWKPALPMAKHANFLRAQQRHSCGGTCAGAALGQS